MPNEQLKENNIQKTLESGLKCFLMKGIEGTQLNDIVALSGISRRSVLRYFNCKEKFVIAVLTFFGDYQYEYGCQLYYKNLKPRCSGLEALKAYLNAVKTIFLENSSYFALLAEGELFLCHSKCQTNSVINNYVGNFTASSKALQYILEQGIKDGSIKHFTNFSPQESVVFCQSFFGMLIHLALSKGMGVYTLEDCMAIIDKFLEMFFASIQ